VCTAATGFTGVTALAIAELSTTEAFAARMSCLPCHGLFSCGATVIVRDCDARVLRHCPTDRMPPAQLRYKGAGVATLAIAGLSTTEACAARTGFLLCRGLLACEATAIMRDNDARVPRRCSAGRVLCAQLLSDSHVWRRWQQLD